ncbi:MAG: synthase complex assembly factor 2 [Caulobacteraceae bacterium]|nr:synthase complex assembly factor 2 [Caulobacteraceae bacterium]
MVQKLAPHVELPRRFYKRVTTGPDGAGATVLLDGKPVRTPKGAHLTAPTQALAQMLAAEWDAQEAHIDMTAMAATRLAFTALDFVADARDAVAAEIGRYAGSDVLCYFAEGPDALVERQVQRWGPVLEWAQQEVDLHLVRAVGIAYRDQPAGTLLRAARLAEKEGDFGLAGIAHATALFGSAVLAFALHRDQLSGEEALQLSRLDEAFQQERWGVDEEAAERTANMLAEARMLERWFRALEP